MPDIVPQEALDALEKARTYWRAAGFSLMAVAKQLVIINDHRWHKVFGHSNFESFLKQEFPGFRSISTVRRAMRVIRELEPVIPMKQLEQVTWQNAELILKMPESKRNEPKLLEAAQTLTESEFRRKIEAHPSNWLKHDEEWGYISVKAPMSLVRSFNAKLDEVWEKLKEEEGEVPRHEAFEHLFGEAMNG